MQLMNSQDVEVYYCRCCHCSERPLLWCTYKFDRNWILWCGIRTV